VNFAYTCLSFCRGLLHTVKSYDMGPTALFPLRRKKEGMLRIFIAVTSPSSSARSEPVNLVSNGKHDNH
jgi:hypothetical protein